MKVILQRSQAASVRVDGQVIGAIDKGLVLLVGVGPDDQQADVDYLVKKVSKMRIFEDPAGKMNLDLAQVGGQILSISQFTLFADTKKGNRPSFTQAAGPSQAQALYEAFNQGLREAGCQVETGQFGAHMAVSLVNDGPVTILLDSKKT